MITKILPDTIDPATGLLTFHASELGMYAPAIETAVVDPPATCVVDYDCNDHDVSTTDTCSGGSCEHAPSTVCVPLDQCHVAGVTPSAAGGSCLTPASSPCASTADCGAFPWLAASCVANACQYAPVACDGADGDGCNDGVLQPDGSCRETGPAMLWDFEEGASPTVLDDSGNHGYGIWNGGAVAFDGAGRFGNALVLTAANAAWVSRKVQIPRTDFTIGIHFKTTQTTGGLFTVAAPGVPGNAAALDRSVSLWNGTLTPYVAFRNWTPPCASPFVNDGAWHHTALTCQSGVGCSLYVDGALACAPQAWNDRSSVGGTFRPSGWDQQSLVVGWAFGNMDQGGFFDGEIDQVTLFDRALDATEIGALQAGILTPDQGNNRPRCDGVDHTCGGSAVVDTACDDGDPCTSGERCSAGGCLGGSATVCAQSACATAACNPETGVCDATYAADGASCDDSEPLTTHDACATGSCVGTPVPGAVYDATTGGYVMAQSGAPSAPTLQIPVNLLKRLAKGPYEWRDSLEPLCTVGQDCDAVEYAQDDLTSYVRSTIASVPGDGALPQATLHLASVGGIEPGSVFVGTTTGAIRAVTCTGKDILENTLTGCTGGTGTVSVGQPVVQCNCQLTNVGIGSAAKALPQTSIDVASAAELSPRGAVTIATSDGPQRVTYTGMSGNTLTGCAGGTGMMAQNSVVNQFEQNRWMIVTAVTEDGTGFVGWEAVKAFKCSDGAACVDETSVCGDGSACTGTPIPGHFRTHGPGYFYAARALGRPGAVLWQEPFVMLPSVFTDPSNAAHRGYVVNPAHIYVQANKKFEVPGIPAFIAVNGKMSFYFGAGEFSVDWTKFGDEKGFIRDTQPFSGLIDGTVSFRIELPIKGTPIKIPLALPLGSASLFFESNPQASPPFSRLRIRATTTELPLGDIKGLEWTKALGVHAEVSAILENADTTCQADHSCDSDQIGAGLRFEVAAPLPIPGGVLPFRGTIQLAKPPGQPTDLSIDARITGGIINLGGVQVELGTFAVNLQYDGEKFCAGTSVAAGTQDVATDANTTQSTTCNLRLCMGKKDDFFGGSVLECAPFCADDSQCDSGQVCIYGTCDAARVVGAACEEDDDCQRGHCYLGLCKECQPGASSKRKYCKDGSRCESSACADGSACIEMAEASLQSDENGGDAARNDEFCDSIGFCQDKVGVNGSCWNGIEARTDWCAADLVCDQTGPASAICHGCYAPGAYNPGVNETGGGCADQKKPNEEHPTKFCNTFGNCQNRLGFGESCYVPALAKGLDAWCSKVPATGAGSCGDPFWTCRQFGYNNLPSLPYPDALDAPSPGCGSDEYCAGASLTCESKLEDGQACGLLGGADDRKCKSGACDRVCFAYHSKNTGESCVEPTSGFAVASMCKSDHCLLADSTCSCNDGNPNTDDDVNCGSNQFCDPVVGTCKAKLPTGASCSLVGGDHACAGGKCSVAGDALPGVCYTPNSQAYGWYCHANGECTSNNCRAGAGDTCGCGGKASECGADQFCGGAFGDTCMNKLNAGEICQQDGRQCKSGQCNYYSPGIYVCGCNNAAGDPDDSKCAAADYCDNNSVCRLRKAAGAACGRTGECWRYPNGNPATCVHNTWNCNGHACNCGTCNTPCFPDVWNVCGTYSCNCSTCYDTCSSDTCALFE